MGTGYRAFISYHHSRVDTPVAAIVQSRLERLRIPAQIREKYGISSLRPIFRDKEELSVSSDLNEVIQAALEESEFLIVICSTTVRESEWVTREIEFFLQSHDRSHILTVLADGDVPRDVMPLILLENEQGEPVAEPLSCDLRPQNRRARKEEIQRLAAALCGCSYDAFRRRYQQYRYRRLAAAGTVLLGAAAGAIGYLSWSNRQIADSLEKVKESAARDLAVLSGSALAVDDRVGALEYAMEALEPGGREGPVVPEAEYALAEALNPYRLPEEVAPDAFPEQVWAEYNYRVDAFLDEWGVCQTESATLLAACDTDRNVLIWDADTHRQVFSRSYAEEASLDMTLSSGGILLLRFADRLETLDLSDPEAGTKTVLSWEPESGLISAVLTLSEDGSLAVLDVDHTVHIIDMKEGVPVLEAAHKGHVTEAVFSPDLRYLAMNCYVEPNEEEEQDDGEDYAVSLLDLESGALAQCGNLMAAASAPSMAFGEDGSFVFTGTTAAARGSFSGTGYGGTHMSNLEKTTDAIICVDAATGKKRWESENPHWMYPHTRVLYAPQIPDPETGEDCSGFICLSGTEGIILRGEDGSLMRQFSLPHSARAYAADGEGEDFKVTAVLEDGELAVYWPWEDALYAAQLMRGTIWSVRMTEKRIFVSCPSVESKALAVPDGIIAYRIGGENPAFIPAQIDPETYCTPYPAGDGFIIHEDFAKEKFAYYDAEGRRVWAVEANEEEIDYSTAQLGESKKTGAWTFIRPPHYGETEFTLLSYALADGECTQETFEETGTLLDGPVAAREADGHLLAGWVCRQEGGGADGAEILTANIWSEKVSSVHSTTFSLPQEAADCFITEVFLSPGGEAMLFLAETPDYDGKLACCIHFPKGEVTAVSTDGTFDDYNSYEDEIIWDEKGELFAYVSEEVLRVYSVRKGLLWEVPVKEFKDTACGFAGGDLYLCVETASDLTMRRYDGESGQHLGELLLVSYENSARIYMRSDEQILKEEDGTLLYLSEDGAFVIDPEEMKLILKIPEARGYNPKSRLWFMLDYGYPERITGLMPRLTLAEMKAQARELLGSGE